MPRIVHCADIHFDTPFSARFSKTEAGIARLGIRDAFSKIIDEAKNADILLIAGDLFDSENVSNDTIRFVMRKFAEIPHVKVFISAGNHDPRTANSPYDTLEWGGNVHIFATFPESVDIEDLNTCIHGVSFNNMHCRESIIKGFEPLEGKTNILLIHGDVVSGGGSEYGPITVNNIENSGMDYIALGHVHAFGGVKKAGRTLYAYSGTPEGRGFDEIGSKGIIVGTVGVGGGELDFKPICGRRYHFTEVDISQAKDSGHIIDIIEAALSETDTKKDYYRVKLVGNTDRKLNINMDIIEKRLKERLNFVEVKNFTAPAFDYIEMAKENGLRGMFVSEMLKKIETLKGEERKIAEDALKYGVQSMSPGEVEIC